MNIAVREAEEILIFPIDPKRGGFYQGKDLPSSFLESEQDAARVELLWEKFTVMVEQLSRNFKSFLSNRSMRDAVFQSGMENVCADFSRTTHNVKSTFVMESHIDRRNGKRVFQYSIRLSKLQDVTELIENQGQSCTAEIPFIPEDATAEMVGTVPTTGDEAEYDHNQAAVQHAVHLDNNNINHAGGIDNEEEIVIPSVPVEIVREAPMSVLTTVPPELETNADQSTALVTVVDAVVIDDQDSSSQQQDESTTTTAIAEVVVPT